MADQALKALEIDELGLDPVDRRMLRAIIENYGGGPVGLETLAATIGEESVTLEDVYEPYLMQLGFLTRTPRGRCVTIICTWLIPVRNNFRYKRRFLKWEDYLAPTVFEVWSVRP